MATQHIVQHTIPQGAYKAESWFQRTLDGALSAERSLTACANQLYPGKAKGAKHMAAIYESMLTIPSSPK